MMQSNLDEGVHRKQGLDEFLASPSIEGARYYLFRWFSSAERPWELLDLIGYLLSMDNDKSQLVAAKIFWPLVFEKWCGFDAIPHREYSRVFLLFRNSWDTFLPDAARKAVSALPATIEIWRGQDETSPVGLSWTTDRAVAEQFAIGHRGLHNRQPLILQRTVRRRSIAFCTNERQESEMVLFRPPTISRRLRVKFIAENGGGPREAHRKTDQALMS